jgi:glycosyltransferase involved in cell wall biosynthesis
MRILHVVPSYKPAYIYGGPIESVSKLCEGLTANGHRVDVFTTTANGVSELSMKPGTTEVVDGVSVTYFKRVTKDPTHISPALWTHLFFHVKNYDIVHIHSWWNILVIIAACICHLRGIKVVISPRGMLSEYIFNSGNTRFKSILHRTIGKYALSKSYFHATADSEYKECKGIIKGWDGFTLPNIITLSDNLINKKQNNAFNLIFLSRIHPKKGLELLFEAISVLKHDVKLKIAGSGDEDYVNSLKLLARDLGIASKIEWLGWLNRDEKFEALMKADLFVLVSMNENFANVVIESLHMGTPVLLSEDVALSGFVKQHDLGWICTLNKENVTQKLTEVYHDQEKRERINRESRKVISHHFLEEKLIRDYVRQYKIIIE